MNDTNRLMLAISIALFAHGWYPEDWTLIAYLSFFLIAMGSETIRDIKTVRKWFSQKEQN
jgi:hypothetical protein